VCFDKTVRGASPTIECLITCWKTKTEKEDVSEKHRDSKNCFTKDGNNLVKAKTLKVLLQFSKHADRSIEFLWGQSLKCPNKCSHVHFGTILVWHRYQQTCRLWSYREENSKTPTQARRWRLQICARKWTIGCSRGLSRPSLEFKIDSSKHFGYIFLLKAKLS